MTSNNLTPTARQLSSDLIHHPLPYLLVHVPSLHIEAANNAAATFFQLSQSLLQLATFPSLMADTERHGLLKKFRNGDLAPFFAVCKTGPALTSVQVFVSQVTEAQVLGVALVPAAPVQQTLHPKEALILDMINEVSDVITVADLDFKPITWSKAAERLYGISREQALGNDLRPYITIEYADTTAAEVRQKALSVGEWKGELGFTRPDGKKLALLVTYKLRYNEAGAPLHYFIYGTDISNRKAAEAKLRESENRFREVADTAPVGIWMSEVENKVIYINEPLARITGVCPHAFNKSVWVSLIHPEDVYGVLKKFREHFHRRLPVTLVYRLRHAQNGFRWVQDSGTPRLLSDGTFLGYIGSIVDIHDTKQREAQLQYQATLMDNILDSVLTTDMNFRVLSLNKVAEEVYGISEAAAKDHRLPLLPFEYINDSKERALEVLKETGVWKGEVYVTVKGTERNFLFTVTYVTDAEKNRIGIMAVGRDITDRKEIEKKLQKSESFYRSLIADSVDGKLLTNIEGTVTFVSPSIENILGYEPHEINGRSAFEFVHPDDRPVAISAFQNELTETAVIRFVEIRLLQKGGNWLWCLVRGHNLLANPHVAGIVISIQDDSQRKQTTDALRESEMRFRALIKDVKLGVTLENAEGCILMHNKAMTELFGVTDERLKTENVYNLYTQAVHEDETPFERHEWPMLRAAQTKNPVENVIIGVPVNGPDDRVWLLVNSNPVLDAAGNIRHIISSFSDVTERKTLVQRLMKDEVDQQRLLSQATIDGQERERKEIGKELHDNIGQQLATTKLYLDLAKNNGATDATEMLNRATKSIMDVINEVRAMSHSLVPPTLGDLGLAESVQELIESVSLVQNFAITFTHIQFDESGLLENGMLMLYRIIQEALTNIAKHAKATAVHVQLTRNARFLLLEICDNGQGFSMDKVRKGLGLANMRNRAELFGGKVSVKAATGAGCNIKVIIPCRYIVREE